jgi:hypothetical protein
MPATWSPPAWIQAKTRFLEFARPGLEVERIAPNTLVCPIGFWPKKAQEIEPG